jgi:hypothetical protein
MKVFTRVMLIGALTLLSAGTAVRAQAIEQKRFTVPFAFQAGSHMLPAGTYRFIPMTGHAEMYLLSDVNSTTQVIVTGDGGDAVAPRTLDSDKVVFERDDSLKRYVMTQVWDAANGAAVQMTGTYPLTRAAKERERAQPDGQVTVNLK